VTATAYGAQQAFSLGIARVSNAPKDPMDVRIATGALPE
jgi:hypothetical protein